MAINVFEYESYKQCVNDWLIQQPKEGHGQLRRMAEQIGIHSVVMSQVFRGDRDLTLEQAVGVARFMALSESERDYFLLLVQHARAGSVELKTIVKKQMAQARMQSSTLKNRVKHESLNETSRATFYSHWYYSAVRLGVSIPGFSSVQSIAEHLGLERELSANIVRFLLENGLIVEKKGGFELGPKVTHLGHDSPYVSRHHMNWRVKALGSLERTSSQDLHYTGPMALSEEAAEAIKDELVRLIEKATKKASSSDSEVLRCLNIDWFAVGRG